MPDVDFAFYVVFFKIIALDSVWFLDNLLLSDYLGCRGRSRILPVSDFILFYFLSLENFFLSFSFSSLLMPNWAESSFALFDFLIKIALFDFNFLHLYSLRGVIAGLLPTHHLRALPPLHVYHQLPAVYRVYESYIFRRILIDC